MPAVISPRRAGFSLIEAVIVLAIVGLVIGGLWVAASTVTKRVRLAGLTETIFSAAAALQSKVSISDSESMGNAFDFTTSVTKMHVFPDSWLTATNTLRTPWGNNVSVANYTPPPRFQIDIRSLSDSDCIHLAVSVAGIAAKAGSTGTSTGKATLSSLSINSPAFVANAFPLTIGNVTPYCLNNNNRMIFVFGYTRLN